MAGYQDLVAFVKANAGDPLSLAKVITAWQWTSLLPGGHGVPPKKPEDVPAVLNASCGWREWLTTELFKTIGIQERQVNFYDVPFQGNHTALELKINGKWMFFDPTFGLYFESKNGGAPLSIEEARANWPNIVVKQSVLPGWQGKFVSLASINPNTAFQTTTDPFLYMPQSFSGTAATVGGELESLFFGEGAAYYDGLRDTFLPKMGRKWVEVDDADDAMSYQRLVERYDPAGGLDFVHGWNDDGSTFFIDYDSSNRFHWSTKITEASPSSQRGFTYIEYDNGTTGIIGTPGADTIIGGSSNEHFGGGLGNDFIDAGGGVDVIEFTGARQNYAIKGNGGGWSVAGPDGSDVLLNVEYLSFADQILPLVMSSNVLEDTSGIRTWETVVSNFDADGRRLNVSYKNDDGSTTVYNYDVLEQFRWTSVEERFDRSNERHTALYRNDDEKITVYQYDTESIFNWESIQTNFDVEGRRSEVHYKNDNETKVVYHYDVEDVYTWTQTARYFNSAGQKIRDVYDNDNGTHAVYEYKPASGALVAYYAFNADWQVIA